jgi:hypothetical protein
MVVPALVVVVDMVVVVVHGDDVGTIGDYGDGGAQYGACGGDDGTTEADEDNDGLVA